MSAAPVRLCEIRAAAPLADDLGRIVGFCGAQAGFPLEVVTRPAGPGPAAITLHLTPAEAAPDHRVWCLVCRLACLCPQARVGALVHAAASFRSAKPAARRSA